MSLLCGLSQNWYKIWLNKIMKQGCEDHISGKIASAPNDPKVILNTMRLKMNHVC